MQHQVAVGFIRWRLEWQQLARYEYVARNPMPFGIASTLSCSNDIGLDPKDKEDKQKRTMLFPVRLDNAVMACEQAWAADIRRTRHIGDMTRWKDHDCYQLAFARLLRDLKAEAG